MCVYFLAVANHFSIYEVLSFIPKCVEVLVPFHVIGYAGAKRIGFRFQFFFSLFKVIILSLFTFFFVLLDWLCLK